MRSIVVLSVILAGAVASTGFAETAAPPAKDGGGASEICVRGRLTGEGAECPALRTADGTLYTLARSGPALSRDGEICVCGRKAEVSTCQQGITLTAIRIGGAGDCH
jgi:hypothetical protein